MNSIEIKCASGKTEVYTAPSSWDELSPKQLKIWSAICLQPIPMIEAKKHIARLFYCIPNTTFKYLKVGQVLQIADTLSFLFESNQLNKWLIKSVRSGFIRYHGPNDFLANLTIAEYRCTELYYQAYVRTQEKKWLILLMATLYREKRKGEITDDIREDLTEHGIAKRERHFSKISPHLLQACLLNYEGCRNHLINKYVRAFKPNQSEQSNEIFDLEEVIEAFAGDKFGSFSETEKTNLHRFFRYMVSSIEQLEENKAS
ncbi:MAG: hypothetical protein U0X71_05920 [Sphingobacteriaceae bacterium]